MSIILKRINKELDYFNNKIYLNDNLNKNFISYFSKLTFNIDDINNYLYVYYDRELLFMLNIVNNYPFHPYKVLQYRNKYSYFKNLVNINSIINTLDKDILIFFYIIHYQKQPYFLLLNNNCYCCKSIVCSVNWCPCHRLNNLLFENIEIIFIEKYLSKLMYRYIYNIYNKFMDMFKLNKDIINLILIQSY